MLTQKQKYEEILKKNINRHMKPALDYNGEALPNTLSLEGGTFIKLRDAEQGLYSITYIDCIDLEAASVNVHGHVLSEQILNFFKAN